ncbi:MAG: glycosyltransferase family 39 protein [Anaerolineae bacterium]|nr:glycosyltransferase family 39 protein [Anaerolineae bacterium]
MPSISPARSPWRARSILWLILLLAFALRSHHLGAQSLWYDETVSVHLASKSLPDLVAHTAGDIHPPGYYVLLHLWLRLTGTTPGLEFLTAFLSLWFGVGIVALSMAIARRLYDARAATLAGLLAAVNPFHIWYSQEVRMYTLGAALGLVCLLAVLRLFSGERRTRWWWFAYVIAATIGLYTLYYIGFLLVTFNLWALLLLRSKADRTALRNWIFAQLVVLMLYAPWLPVLWRQATQPPVPPWRILTSLAKVLVESATALAAGQSLPLPAAALPLVLALALYGLGLARLPRSRAALLFLHTWGSLLLILLFSYFTPLYHVRYTFTYAPPFLIVVAAGLARVRPRVLSIAAASALLIAAAVSLRAFWYSPIYAADDHRTAVQFLADRWRPGDAVLVNAGYAYSALVTYWPEGIGWRGRLTDPARQTANEKEGTFLLQTGTVDGAPSLGWGSPTSDFYAMPQAEAKAALAALFARVPRVWVYRIYDTVTDPDGVLRTWLDEHGREFEDQVFAGEANLRVQGWLTQPTDAANVPPDATRIEVTLGSALTLAGVTGVESSVRAGDSLDAVLFWRGEKRIANNLATSLRLVGQDNENWAQVDEWPLGSLMLVSTWPPGNVIRHPIRLKVPEGTPPGKYELQLAVYDPASGAALSAPEGPLSVPGVGLRLGSVTVITGEGRACANWPRPLATLGVLRLERAEVAPETYRAGGHLPLALYWRSCPAARAAAEPYEVVLKVRDARGRVVAEAQEPFVGGRYPSSSWPAGAQVRDRYNLALPGNLETGIYRLAVGLMGQQGGKYETVWRWGLWPIGDEIEVAWVRVEARSIVRTPPSPSHASGARLGDAVRLAGYDLDARAARAGGTVRLTLYWQAIAPVGADYKVFTHLLDAGEEVRGQRDSVPDDGRLPTSGWVAGEYVTDHYIIPVAADAPPGLYHIAVGMYQEGSSVRLPAFDVNGKALGDRVLLGPVEVR